MNEPDDTKHRRRRAPGEKKWCGRDVGVRCQFGPWSEELGSYFTPRWVRQCVRCNKRSYASRIERIRNPWTNQLDEFLLPGGAPVARRGQQLSGRAYYFSFPFDADG